MAMETNKKLLEKYAGLITSEKDLTGDSAPSILYGLLCNRMRYLLDEDPQTITPRSIQWRRNIHFLIRALGPAFLHERQIIENRNQLRNPNAESPLPDTGIQLPKAPVIWAANHGFKDDVAATILAAQRHTYLVLASLPIFFNTLDGISSWAIGVILANRKIQASRKTVIPKAVRCLSLGADITMFPEGVWNKSPNRLLLDLWPGIYRIACETGSMVVPVVHYIRDDTNQEKHNPIHTVVDDPVRIDDLSESAALSYLRDIMATWYYLMMERYGKSTRAEVLGENVRSAEYWEKKLTDRRKTASFYDREIETCADYRPRWKTEALTVWESIAAINEISAENADAVAFASNLIEQLKTNDFQRRF